MKTERRRGAGEVRVRGKRVVCARARRSCIASVVDLLRLVALVFVVAFAGACSSPLDAQPNAGAPHASVHSSTFVDANSPENHGAWLRARRWRPMLDRGDPDLCGTCHEGAPVRTDPPRRPAPGATACTKCHDGANGPLACDTCHRELAHHAPHVLPSAAKAEGIACAACHPTPKLGELVTGTHGDGRVEVWLPEGADAFDSTTKECATRCHAGPSAARPKPAWTETTKMTCKDCHGSPPTPHLAGACSNCHREANAKGDALMATKLHLDGNVEVGDGSGTCGACHGVGDDPWPRTGAHAAHELPMASVKVDCVACHVIPRGTPHPLGTPAVVAFSGLAAHGGLAPTYDAATKTCANVYCHALRGASLPTPRWTDGGKASSCGSCHGVPPTAPHTPSSACGTGSCHGNSVSGGVLTPAGIAHHVDGKVDLSIP